MSAAECQNGSFSVVLKTIWLRIIAIVTTLSLIFSFTVPSEQSRAYDDDCLGPLKINIHSAKLTRDTEWVGKMDPYVTFKIPALGVEIETEHLDGAGKTPEWNHDVAEQQVKDLSA